MKLRKVREFLLDGQTVKLTILFRGREIVHPGIGTQLLETIAEQLADAANRQSSPVLDGKRMTMNLIPRKRG